MYLVLGKVKNKRTYERHKPTLLLHELNIILTDQYCLSLTAGSLIL